MNPNQTEPTNPTPTSPQSPTSEQPVAPRAVSEQQFQPGPQLQQPPFQETPAQPAATVPSPAFTPSAYSRVTPVQTGRSVRMSSIIILLTGVLTCIFGVFTLIGGIVEIAGSFGLGIIMGIVDLIIGVGMLRRRNWARIAFVALMFATVLIAIGTLVAETLILKDGRLGMLDDIAVTSLFVMYVPLAAIYASIGFLFTRTFIKRGFVHERGF